MKTQTPTRQSSRLKTRAADQFNNLRPEDEQPKDRSAQVTRSPALDEMVRNFDEFLRSMERMWPAYIDSDWEERYMGNIIPTSKEPSAANITAFAIELARFQGSAYFNRAGGLYISSLINNSNDTNFTLTTNHLEKKLSHLGFLNSGKTIEVIGVLEGYCGRKMTAGLLRVRGSVTGYLGQEMSGGTIEIEGNAGNLTGENMSGGKIIVKGDCLGIGRGMQGGEIHVYGNSGEITFAPYRGGKIFFHGAKSPVLTSIRHRLRMDSPRGEVYHQGKLIWNSGTFL